MERSKLEKINDTVSGLLENKDALPSLFRNGLIGLESIQTFIGGILDKASPNQDEISISPEKLQEGQDLAFESRGGFINEATFNLSHLAFDERNGEKLVKEHQELLNSTEFNCDVSHRNGAVNKVFNDLYELCKNEKAR